MALVHPSIAERPAQSFLARWVGMASGDIGDPVDYVGHADRTVQVIGDFNGATVTLQGSLDGDNWATLNDAQGQPMTFTQAGIEAVTEIVLFIRPVVTGGSASDISVYLLLRKTMG